MHQLLGVFLEVVHLSPHGVLLGKNFVTNIIECIVVNLEQVFNLCLMVVKLGDERFFLGSVVVLDGSQFALHFLNYGVKTLVVVAFVRRQALLAEESLTDLTSELNFFVSMLCAPELLCVEAEVSWQVEVFMFLLVTRHKLSEPRMATWTCIES